MATLLILDDSVSVRKLLIENLRPDGDFKHYLEAEDGKVGLKILREKISTVDVVVCDLNMPKIDGYTFLKLVRADSNLSDVPIVMLTSRAEETEVVKAFERGANDYIVKPFTPSILRARLKNMLQIKQLQDQLKVQKRIMQELAATDPLTNLANVRTFRQSLTDELESALRYEHPVSVLMADLDHFKKVNDTYGHPCGDSVLKEAASIMLKVMRKVDIVARYGGEEFVVIMPQTDTDSATRAAERLRVAVEGCHFDGLPAAGDVTVSIGVATLVKGVETDMDGLIKQADEALYKAKMNGRNRVEKSDTHVK